MTSQKISRRTLFFRLLGNALLAIVLIFLGRPAAANMLRACTKLPGANLMTPGGCPGSVGGERLHPGPSPDGPLQPPRMAGSVVTEIASADNAPFGYLGGMALTPDGGVWAADSQAERVYLFDAAGSLANRIGRGGDGPGELREPCCITLAHDRLWVLSPGRRRIDVFPLAGISGGRSADAHRILLPGAYIVLYHEAPVVIDGGESVAVTVMYKDPSRDYRKDRHVSLEISWSGSVIAESPAPTRPGQHAGAGIAEAVYPRSVSSLPAIALGIPFGPRFLRSRNKTGTWATVFTGVYDVSLQRPGGTPLTRIARTDVTGPPLLPKETASAQATLQSWARQARVGGGRLFVTDPLKAKPPIHHVWFDSDDRLWVQLSTAGDDPHSQGDVYSNDGTPLFHAEWPRGIDLRHGAAAGQSAWGIRETALEEQILTLVHFAPFREKD